MDLFFFLHQRTQLIQHFYDSGVAPFTGTKRSIDDKKAPFENPPYSEDPEPPYLEEWLQANTEEQLVGRACIAMLSESLKLYFQQWERQLRIRNACVKHFPKIFKEQGFVAGYTACFNFVVGIDWNDCPADMGIIEQIVLARNHTQHAGDTWPNITHPEDTREKYPNPFFATPDDIGMDDEGGWFLAPSIIVRREHVVEAIRQVDLLGAWLQERLYAL